MTNPTATAAAVSEAVTAGANTDVITIPYIHSFTFKNYKEGQAGHAKLVTMVEEGKLSVEDITITVPKESEFPTEAERAANTVYRRNNKEMELNVPLVSSFINGALSPAQIDHLQALVNKAIAQYHQEAVSEHCDFTVHAWQHILEQSPAARTSQVKVTAEMLDAAIVSLSASMELAGITPEGQDRIRALASKKFNAASIQRITLPILQRIQVMLANWYTALEPLEQNEHQPVLKLWSEALERALTPEANLEDLFA